MASSVYADNDVAWGDFSTGMCHKYQNCLYINSNVFIHPRYH